MFSNRTHYSRAIALLCAIVIVSFSGCATAPKPTASPSPEKPPISPPVIPSPAAAAPEAMPPKSITPPDATHTPNSSAPPLSARRATLKGSQEGSILLDNYTAFVVSIDGKRNAAGRDGWDSPLTIEAGRRVIEVEFNRGVFMARTTLELEAKANAHYELRFATDAELFGHNSYCDFWIIDLVTGKTVTAVSKASVEKRAATSNR